MRPKARGLAQQGGPPGWLEKSDPAGYDFVLKKKKKKKKKKKNCK
jgi:hypothetical protein